MNVVINECCLYPISKFFYVSLLSFTYQLFLSAYHLSTLITYSYQLFLSAFPSKYSWMSYCVSAQLILISVLDKLFLLIYELLLYQLFIQLLLCHLFLYSFYPIYYASFSSLTVSAILYYIKYFNILILQYFNILIEIL